METVDIHIRIPRDVADALKARADQDERSLNSELVVALREWLAALNKGRR